MRSYDILGAMSETNGNGLPPVPPAIQGKSRRSPPKETQFKPGQSGNPTGRPKGKTISGELRKLIEKEGAKEAAKVILAKMRKGDMRAAEIVLDRTEGKVTQRVENVGAQSIIVIEGVREDAL